jgi:DNA-binding HxlR family transcriptional regulator
MVEQHRSGCPINLSLEVLGDKWSLVIIRDMMFGNRRHHRDRRTAPRQHPAQARTRTPPR